MPKLTGTLRSIRRILLVVMIVGGFGWVTPFLSGQAGQASQRIYIPDPTPRPIDLHKKYGEDNDAAERLKQQQLAIQKVAQRRQEIESDTDKLVVLAKELQNELAQRSKDSPKGLGVAKAQQIEKLAKSVKEKMQTQ